MSPGIYYALAFACGAGAAFAPTLICACHPVRPFRGAAGATVLAAIVSLLVVAIGAVVGSNLGAFYEKHWTGISPGSVRYGADRELAGYHGVLVFLCLFAGSAVVWHLVSGRRPGRAAAGLFGLLTAGLAFTAFAITVPRGGDEGIVLWLIIGPVMALTALALAIVSIVLAIRGWRPIPVPAEVGAPFCSQCGYNLTGNLSGRCPECGTSVADELKARCGASLKAPMPSRPRASGWPAAMGAAAFGAGVFNALMGILRLHSLLMFGFGTGVPLLGPFLALRREPAPVGLLMGGAMMAAGIGIRRRRRWAVPVCVIWCAATMLIESVDILFAVQRWTAFRAGLPSGLPLRVVVPHFLWGFGVPAMFLLWLVRPKVRDEIATWGPLPKP